MLYAASLSKLIQCYFVVLPLVLCLQLYTKEYYFNLNELVTKMSRETGTSLGILGMTSCRKLALSSPI